MNTFKLLLTASLFLSLNAFAADTSSSNSYTQVKNSGYLSALEKQRNASAQDRENREDVREYMRLKRDLQK